jgi:hypothetical protein
MGLWRVSTHSVRLWAIPIQQSEASDHDTMTESSGLAYYPVVSCGPIRPIRGKRNGADVIMSTVNLSLHDHDGWQRNTSHNRGRLSHLL